MGKSGRDKIFFCNFGAKKTPMILLYETYHCKADPKGRIALPVGLKAVLEEVLDQGLILRKSLTKPCLELHTAPHWQEILGKIRTLNTFDQQNLDFIRRFTAHVKNVEVDAAGRFLIPKMLFDIAQLDKEIALIPMIDYMEIWNKELYDAEMEKISDTDFAKEVTKRMTNDAQ